MSRDPEPVPGPESEDAARTGVRGDTEGRSRHGNGTRFRRESCPVPRHARSRVPMVRFRTPESASPGESPGESCDCTAPRVGNTADGTQRQRAYSPDRNRRHRSMDAVAREAAGNADRPQGTPPHLGRRRGPKTLADQVPEHFPVDRRPGRGEEAWLITPRSVPRLPSRLFRTGLPRGERAAWAAARRRRSPTDDGSTAEPSALTHVAVTGSTIRRWSTASTSTAASCRCGTTAPAPRASSATADTTPCARGGRSHRVRSGQGLDEVLPVGRPTLPHRFRLGESDHGSFRPRARLPRPHPDSRLPLLPQSQPSTASAN